MDTPKPIALSENLTTYEQLTPQWLAVLLSGRTIEQQQRLILNESIRRRVPARILRDLGRRLARALQQRQEQIQRLREPCLCRDCLRFNRPRFPRYYVVSHLSYECYLERQAEDSEMEELLAPLRNRRDRIGSVFLRPR